MRSVPLDGLADHIDHALDAWNVPGAAVAVVIGDQAVYLAGHGVKEAGGNDRVDENTLFQIGSTSKAFATAALGVLVDQGRLRWDDPVVTQLPMFRLHDSQLTKNLTIRDAVTHASGFVDSFVHSLEIMDTAEAVYRMRYCRSPGAFRDSYNYSNLMYGLAGQIVATASGVSWHEFVRSHLFEPLGMARSGTSPYDFWDARFVAPTIFGTAPAGRVSAADSGDPNVAMPHTLQDGTPRVIPWQSYDTLAAAGGVVSSASDLTRWLALHLNGGTFAGRGILDQETMRELHTAQNPHGRSSFPFDPDVGAYAMGWRREKYRGHPHVSHSGLMLGFPAQIAMLPQEQVGIVILANAQQATFESYALGVDPMVFHKAISLWVFDRVLGVASTNWTKRFRDQTVAAERAWQAEEDSLQASRDADSCPGVCLEQLVGAYQDRSKTHGRVKVTLAEGRLVLSYPGPGAFSAYLDHWRGDLFRLRPRGVRYLNSFVTFAMGPGGTVESMSALGGDFRPTS